MALEAIELLDSYLALCKESNSEIIPHFKKSMESAITVGEVPVVLTLKGNLREHNFSIKDENFQLLSQPLLKTSFLKTLDLSYNRLTDQAAPILAQMLASNSFKLESLILKMNNMGHVTAKYLSEALLSNDSLKHLNLSNNEIENEGGMFLASMLQVNSTLKKLEIASCGLKTEAILSFYIVLLKNTGISYIDLGDPLRRHSKDDLIVHATKLIHINPRLKHIGISKHSITDTDAEIFSKCLGVTCNLESIDISRNNIMADGCICLSDYLKYNETIKYLDLSHNQILFKGAVAISRYLKWDTNLRQ
ncbi:hypothetical protein O9G_003690 [Rozella allomycis CSF55]|uniref:RNI-like protein n=1 Tax=Rozella allomycis (strain CSF55) TaxID=988480 RepID=A0A075B386_ROZAC|nr:hypothetical protein O9G_003690 [Rozella allomycis CSF55]|eukprot:EPZ35431.1 hypothetical protein O9G_003690 [Rozella allomycis CSF55]